MEDRPRGSRPHSRLGKFAIAGVIAMLAVGGSFLWLPAIGSVSAEALHTSVSREVGGGTFLAEVYQCRQGPGRRWTCVIEDPAGSGSAEYQVRRHGRCWQARRVIADT